MGGFSTACLVKYSDVGGIKNRNSLAASQESPSILGTIFSNLMSATEKKPVIIFSLNMQQKKHVTLLRIMGFSVFIVVQVSPHYIS